MAILRHNGIIFYRLDIYGFILFKIHFPIDFVSDSQFYRFELCEIGLSNTAVIASAIRVIEPWVENFKGSYECAVVFGCRYLSPKL